MKYLEFKNRVVNEVTRLLEEAEVSLSQRRNAIKMMNLYFEFVKSDRSADELIQVVREFISKTKGKDRLKVRNVYVSMTTVKKYSEKQVTLRKTGHKKGGCKVDYDLVGRVRLCEPGGWQNARNRELKRKMK